MSHDVGRSLNSLLLPPMFLLTWVLPSVVFIVFSSGSMGAGTVLCALAWIALGAAAGRAPLQWARSLWRLLGIALAVVALLFVHGIAVDLWLGGVDFSRLVASSVVLVLMLLAAYCIAKQLLAGPAALLTMTAYTAFVVLTLIGFGAVAGLPSLGGGVFGRPVIVFSEPSHFSFAYLPVFIFTVALARRGAQFLLLGLGAFLAVALQSMTLLLGVFAVSCMVLRGYQLLVLLGAAASIVGFLALDLTYFLGRLALSGNSDNLSVLAFLQGWQRAELNFSETWGLGIGFQQFGYVGSLGDLAERIVRLLGESLNLYDGGSTGSKLIAELGLVGVVLIGLYLRLVVRGFGVIRRAQLAPSKQRDVRTIFVYSLIVAYGSELFIRGAGYLSPSGLFVLAALITVPQLGASSRRTFDSGIDPQIGRSVPASH
jgi:hypothetical protein